jgi:hypothetical protein
MRTFMTTNKKDSAPAKKSRVKISKLQVNKETIKDLTDVEAEQIKGGSFYYYYSTYCGGNGGFQPTPPGSRVTTPNISYQGICG